MENIQCVVLVLCSETFNIRRDELIEKGTAKVMFLHCRIFRNIWYARTSDKPSHFTLSSWIPPKIPPWRTPTSASKLTAPLSRPNRNIVLYGPPTYAFEFCKIKTKESGPQQSEMQMFFRPLQQFKRTVTWFSPKWPVFLHRKINCITCT